MTPTMVLREGQATHSVIPVRETWPSLKGTAAGDFPGLEKLKGRELPRPAVTIDPSNLWKGAGLNKIKEAEAALPVAWEKSSWDDEPTEFDRSSLRQIAVQEQRLKELPTRFRLNEAAGEWEEKEQSEAIFRGFESEGGESGCRDGRDAFREAPHRCFGGFWREMVRAERDDARWI